jgi:WD40 repeat protein
LSANSGRYDLKTASRLYVLEPHKKAISSVNFSPDGRRLLTVSLNDGDVTVWKVGSSLSGFFNVGGPPRQGGERGEPFKRIVFKRADDGESGP